LCFSGAAHWQDLEKQLEVSGVSLAVVIPSGVSWPRENKDEETIYSDMRELGAQLKDCTLELGDGGKANIKIPIE
jgi:hypothetical protein